MSEPKISIIVPVYNAEKYLHQCVDSILAQTYTDFEVLLINDGSKDGSGAICDEYAAKDDRVRVFHKENGGVSSARNMGLDNARGEWIYFPDADDELYPNALEILLSGVEKDYLMTIAGYEVYNDAGEKTYSIEDRNKGVMNRNDALMEMFQSSPYRYQGYLWCKIFNKSIIINSHLRFDERIIFNEDRLFCVKYLCVLSKEATVAYNWCPVYRYVERSNSAMASLKQKFNPNFITDLHAFQQMGDLLRGIEASRTIRKAHKSAMISSHNWFSGMMREFGIHDMQLRIKNEKYLFQGIGCYAYIKFYIGKAYRKFKRIIQKICKPS